ncbi:MAG: type II/IV secretion system protein [Gammaproteobacteria bacterium]|nr:type II/IV secretion system protein [Gammaproteobacteria bacterium]
MVPAEDFDSSGIILYKGEKRGELQQKVRFMLSSARTFESAEGEVIERAIRFWRAELSPTGQDGDAGTDEMEVDEEHLKELASDAPVIRLVNHFIARALDLAASDVHFEPEESELAVRARVDGVMVKIDTISAANRTAVASRLKLMARMDIGEKRLPQDGRIGFQLGGRRLDLRVSTLPGVHGESIVLRILDRGDLGTDLNGLGMPSELLARYNALTQQPNGMILITGPTGSGKTTTLYATLDKLNTGNQKIITVEDPVEYQLPGVTQVQVNSAIGLNFAAGLRSIVRQDPDIILIGEIRDQETADIACESALTGHLVFSTLHTNDAAGAVSRLMDIGVEPYLISASLLAVQAQRLVRRVCPRCVTDHPLKEDEAQALHLPRREWATIKRGTGCEYCGGTGYRGRIGLYELLPFSSAIRRLVNAQADTDEIRAQAVSEGMVTLRQDALDKLKLGVTTPEEVIRVTSARH